MSSRTEAPRPALALPSVLPDPRPTRDKDAALVQAMFDRVAPRYDTANTLLSAGQDRRWRRAAVVAVAPRPGEVVLDVAAGTGALAHELRASGARVVALDLSWRMLVTGAAREGPRRTLDWISGDGTRLPFRNAAFDAATIAFGLRNLPDPEAGLRELARVTRPGARLAVLEFSRPTFGPYRRLYQALLRHAMPAAARTFASDPAAYGYLAESILAWPDQTRLAGVISAAGWSDVRWRDLARGVVALHTATR